MVAWFIIAIGTLALFAFIAINGVQTVASTTDSVGRTETTRRLDAAVSALVSRSGSPNNTGKMMLLAGQTVDGVYGLPSELSTYATTAFGQRIVYCPFGDGEAGTATVNIPFGGGASYEIETRPDSSGRVYVTAGRPSLPQVAENPNLMGYLLAPRTKTSSTPTCGSVRFNANTRRFEAPNAMVRPIIRETSSEERREASGREVVYYVSTTGTGRGTAPTDRASLYDAMTYYRSAQPDAMRIIMTAGNYVLPANYMDRAGGGFSDKGSIPSLLIEGNGSNLDFENVSNINMPGGLQLRNLTVTSSAGLHAFENQSISLENTSTGFLYAGNGGEITGSNVAIITTSLTNGITAVDGSKITLSNTINLTQATTGAYVVSERGSSITVHDALMTMQNAGTTTNAAIYVGLNSAFTATNVNLVFNSSVQYPMATKSNLSLVSTNVTFNAPQPRGVEIQGGGSFAMTGGTLGLGAAPTYGIVDYGASSVTGTGVIRASNFCWYSNPNIGIQFNHSATGNGASSAVTTDEALPALSPSPTSAQITAHSAAQARNTMRAQIRSTNSSNFTCQIG